MCVSAVETLRDLDTSGEIELIDLHDPGARRRFPDLESKALLEELHAVDDRGRVFRGAKALKEIARRQKGLAHLVSWLWYLPGFERLADKQYKALARSRYRLSGDAARKGALAPTR